MRLSLSASGVATVRVLRNVGYVPGRDVTFPYTVELDPTDYPLGTTLVSATLSIEDDFGFPPVVTKTITTVASAAGQITNAGATGVGALAFALTPADLNLFTGTEVFEVVVVDSLGRQGSLDAGAVVRLASTIGAPVDRITVSPSEFSVAAPATQQLTATLYDANNNVLVGRLVTWSSSDNTIAEVDSTGLVTGVQAGSAIITATSEGKTGTSAATTTVMSEAQFLAMHNAMDPAQIDGMFIRSINQTVVVDGTSPSGFRCTRWKDAVNPTNGKDKVPSGAFAGAPCLANGAEFAEGLEWPSSAGFGTVAADTTAPTNVGSTGLQNGLFADRTKGRTWIAVGCLHWQHDYLLVGENDGTGLRYRGQDQFRYYILGGAGGMAYGHKCIHAIYSGSYPDATQSFGAPGTKRLTNWRVGRDIINTVQPYQNSLSGTDLTVGGARRVRSFASSVYGSTAGTAATSPQDAFIHVVGRQTARQWKLMCDWIASQSWGTGLYEDTRDFYAHGGDSYDEDCQATDLIAGLHTGAPVIANLAVIAKWDTTQPWGFDSTGYAYARAAMDPHGFLYPMLDWTARDMDTSKRSLYIWRWSEWQNAGNVSTALPQNYYMVDQLKAISSKFKVVMFESTRGNNGGTGLNQAINADLDANYASHADGLSMIWHMTPNNPYHFSATEQPNKLPICWLNKDIDGTQHPKSLPASGSPKDLWIGDMRLQIQQFRGVDISGYTSWCKPSVDHVALTAGGSTYQSVWQTLSTTQAVLAGKTLTYVIDRPYLASVDASGVVTPLQGGQCILRAFSNDGVEGLLALTIAMPTPGSGNLSNTFTGADNTPISTADTGQALGGSIGAFKLKANHASLATPQSGFELYNEFLYPGPTSTNPVWSLTCPTVEAQIGFVFSCTDLSNGYMCIVDLDNNFYVFRIENNDQIVIHPEQAVSGGLQAGDMYRVTRTTATNTYLVEVVRSGSTIASHTVVDAAIQGGRYAGAFARWIGTTGSWDNLTGT